MKESKLHKHTFIVNVSVMILHEGLNIVIQKRSMNEDKNPGKWGIPGGKLDATDKSVEEGLRREVREELGIQIKDIHLFESHITQDDGKNKLYMVFTANLDLFGSIMPVFIPTPEVETVDILSFASLPSKEEFTPNTYELITQLFLREGVSK